MAMPRIPGEAYIMKRKKQSAKDYNRSRPALHDFYHTTAWATLRAAYRSDHPLCEMCLKENRVTEADVVDHIVEIADGGEPLAWDNLQSLCHACHNRKTRQEREKRKTSQNARERP